MEEIFKKIIQGVLIALGTASGGQTDTNTDTKVPEQQPAPAAVIKPYQGVSDLDAHLAHVGKFGGPGTVYYVEVKPDSNRDLTAAIQNAIDKIPDGTYNNPSIIRFRPGKYLTNGDLQNNKRGERGVFMIENRNYLIFESDSLNPATIFTSEPAVPSGSSGSQQYSKRRHFWFVNSKNIVMRHLRIEGSNTVEGHLYRNGYPHFWKGNDKPDAKSRRGSPAYLSYWEFEHAIALHGSENVLLENLDINGVFGDGVYVASDKLPSKNIVMRNLNITNTGRQGIAVCFAQYVLIENIHQSKGRRSSIDFEPNFHNEFVYDVEVRNSSFDTWLTFIAAKGRGEVSNIVIRNNEYLTTGHSIIAGDSKGLVERKNWLFENNVRRNGFGSPAPDFQFSKFDGVVLRNNDNNINPNRSRLIASFSDSKNIVIEGNDFGGGKFYIVNGETKEIDSKQTTAEPTR